MKSLLVAALLALSTTAAYAQVRVTVAMPPSTDQNPEARAAYLAQALAQAEEVAARVAEFRKIEEALGGLALTADHLELDASGKVVHASGNVSIRTNETIIKADDATVENGNIQLGANARVIIAYPVKMIQ